MKLSKTENLNMAKQACLEYKSELKKIDIKCHIIYFGEEVSYGPDGDEETVENEAILILEKEIDKYEQIYNLGWKLREKYKDEFNFEIDFMTMEKSKHFNETVVLADGYTHRYKDGSWKKNEIDLTGKTFKTKWV